MAASTRLWPRLQLIGNPKSGSTFLFSCLRSGPFDPNLLYGTTSSAWGDGAYLLTTLGTKKEFNFFGGPGYSWGWEWYLGAPAPLSAWEWPSSGPVEPDDGRRRRRGENGNGEPSAFVEQICKLEDNVTKIESLPSSSRRRRRGGRGSSACRRFPLECVEDTPLVRPGCALVRPFPARRRCGRAGQPACEQPRVRMSHAWPPVAGTSARALTIDPSINTFMSAPAAAKQLRTHTGSGASALRFIVILREPLSRAQSSARMMREWKWDKSANISAALLGDLASLSRCCDLIAPASRAAVSLDGSSGMETAASPYQRAASELPRLTDRPLRRFQDCLAHAHPLNHVRASIYSAAVLGWLSAGFSPSQFLWLETEAMRAMPAAELLTTVAAFAGLPTAHLGALPEHVRRACEVRRLTASAVAAAQGGGASATARRLGGVHVDERMLAHAPRALPPAVSRALQEAFRPFNELLRTLLGDIASTLRRASWLQ